MDDQVGGITPCFGVLGENSKGYEEHFSMNCGEMVLWRPNFSTWRQHDNGEPYGYDSHISSLEFREGPPQSKCTCLGPRSCISHNEGSLVVDLSAFGPISHGPLEKKNDLCADVVFETEEFAPNSVDSSVIPFSRIISEGKFVVDLSVFGHLHNVDNDSFSSGAGSADDFGSEYEEDGDISETVSGDSEAEETWNISQALGLRFKGCKEAVTEVFKNLEKEDRIRGCFFAFDADSLGDASLLLIVPVAPCVCFGLSASSYGWC
ncbi:hypothetical protein REPUB_Repub18cG0144000 [Reevesia pubescens]